MRKENNQYYLDYLVTKYEKLVNRIEKEVQLPACGDYNCYITAEDRLEKILGMIENFKEDL
jgi:hypothetical protein